MNSTIETKVISKTGFSHSILKIITAAFVIFIILVLFTIVSQYNNIKKNKTQINANWPKYRCQAHVLPFAGWLVGPPGVSGVENFLECGLLIFKNSFLRFMTPVYIFLENLLNVILDLMKSVENIRKMFSYLRNSIETFLLDIGNMLYGYGKKLSYLFNRLIQTFSLVFKTFYYLLYALAYGIYALSSVWNGPIGGTARYFCFPGFTLIDMANGTKKIISKIKIGEKIAQSGKVLAIFKLNGKNIPLHAYTNENKKIFVSGDHLVKEEKWVRVADSNHSELTGLKENTLYCLLTEKGTICIQGILFADYHEYSDPQTTTLVRSLILQQLNNEYNPEINKLPAERYWGIHENTIINGKKIKHMKIGDILTKGEIVEGIVKVNPKYLTVFHYKGLHLSGDTLVHKEQKWVPVRCLYEAKRTRKEGNYYHLLTSSNEFSVNGIRLKDFDQTLDESVNLKIDFYVEKMLNKDNLCYS
jgi:hypothetical protein